MDEEEIYRQKYLKYKNKYLELKAQSGGQTPQPGGMRVGVENIGKASQRFLGDFLSGVNTITDQVGQKAKQLFAQSAPAVPSSSAVPSSLTAPAVPPAPPALTPTLNQSGTK